MCIKSVACYILKLFSLFKDVGVYFRNWENAQILPQNLNILQTDCSRKEILSLKLQKYERFMTKRSYIEVS